MLKLITNKLDKSLKGYSNPSISHNCQLINKVNFGYYAVMSLVWILFFLTLPFSLCFCVKIIQEYKRMVNN